MNDESKQIARQQNYLAMTRPSPMKDGGREHERRAVARCLEIIRETRDGFLSEEYATDQPLSSFQERFACTQCAEAIENEFGLGTDEQCRLLGKPTPLEQFCGDHLSQEAK